MYMLPHLSAPLDLQDDGPQVTPTTNGLDLSLYKDQDRLCMIYGSIGQGKTTLLQAIIKTL